MRTRFIGLLMVFAVITTAACGNSDDDDAADSGSSDSSAPAETGDGEKVPVDQPGVTDDTIRVGGFASVTNILNGPYGSAFDGVDAYFDRVNDAGGMYGRKLELVARHDDAMGASQQKINELLTRDNVFAVLPVATLLFNGAQRLADERVPTFGWNIQKEWALGDNFFGDKGSYLCTDCADTFQVAIWMANQVDAKQMAVTAYSVDQSRECGEGLVKGIKTMDNTPELAFQDLSIEFGVRDLSTQVKRMKDKGVDFVATCMDQNGVVTLANEMRKQGLAVPMFLPNAYDQKFLAKQGDVLEGSFVLIEFTPFELPKDEKPKGLLEFEQTMKDAGKEDSINEIGLAGWLSADMFVKGLQGAGPNFTRDKVIESLNKIKDYTADGILPGIDWSIEHKKAAPLLCNAIVQVEEGGKLKPAFTEPGKPFICFKSGATAIPEEPAARK
ncbi:MAG TPA: ABC transporter substrate-binding protein [Acidimicrobiales bacterium]|nr:ABC transporter substrate-binding protein [Acidimicrobiales bacterium]